MKLHFAMFGCISLSLGTAAFADTVVYSDGELTQQIRVDPCAVGESCTNKLTASFKHKFTYNFASFDELFAYLDNFVIETTTYDAVWDEPEVINATVKVNGQVVRTEKFTRNCPTCKKRRRLDRGGDDPKKESLDTANKIYSTAVAGAVIEIESDAIVAPVSSATFTVNVKRYNGESLLGSQSRAWFSIGGNNGSGSTHMQ